MWIKKRPRRFHVPAFGLKVNESCEAAFRLIVCGRCILRKVCSWNGSVASLSEYSSARKRAVEHRHVNGEHEAAKGPLLIASVCQTAVSSSAGVVSLGYKHKVGLDDKNVCNQNGHNTLDIKCYSFIKYLLAARVSQWLLVCFSRARREKVTEFVHPMSSAWHISNLLSFVDSCWLYIWIYLHLHINTWIR